MSILQRIGNIRGTRRLTKIARTVGENVKHPDEGSDNSIYDWSAITEERRSSSSKTSIE